MQPETQDLKNAYTDAPELHPNLFLGSLQLLLWLFFHPTAWRNYIACIAPELRSDLSLAELNWTHLRNPVLFRLLVQGCIVGPLLVGSFVSLLLLIRSASVEFALVSAIYTVMVGLTFSAASSIAINVTIGVVSSIVISALVGIPGSAGFDADTSSVMAGMAIGVIGNIAVELTGRRSFYSLTRQIGGVIIGVSAGSIAYIAMTTLSSRLTVGVPGNLKSGIVGGLGGGLIACIVIGMKTEWRRGISYGVVGGLMYCIVVSATPYKASNMLEHIYNSITSGVVFGASFGISVFLPYVLAEYVAGPLAGAVAGTLVGWGRFIAVSAVDNSLPPWSVLFLSFVSISLGLTLARWRPILTYPLMAMWNLLLYRTDDKRRANGLYSLLRWHSAFWDEFQQLRLFNLDDHLLLVMERNPTEGQAAIEYLATSHQRWAAQAVQIELDARSLEHCADAPTIGHVYQNLAAGELTGPASALLRSFSRLSQDIDAALRQESAYNQRLALSAVEDRLDGLLRELIRSDEPYAVRFHPIADHWRQLVAGHVRELAAQAEQRQEIDSPYIIGVPLTEQQEIFVGRTDVSARIEELLLDRRRPPLLLYGQRRMGKTSLLNNLGRLLPSTIVPLFVDLQGPPTQASDHVGLLYNLARGMLNSAQRQRGLALPPLTRESLVADPFTRFDEWLDQIEQTLDDRGHNTALLALDEFEALDRAITQGRFDEQAVLGTLRHLIQHRSRFKVLLTSSHVLDELQRWASYLINVQMVHISYLNEDETRQLVERPVQDFTLRYEPDASQRVLDLTRGHPALVQLLCAEIVALKNEQPPAVRRLARLDDVEAAVPESLGHGSFFFADIQRNQVDAAGLALLRFMAAQGEGAVVSRQTLERQFSDPGLSGVLALLARRELIETVDDSYRFQVELIRRWFSESSNKND